MKYDLRIALPPLAEFGSDSLLPFALFDRKGQLQHSGEATAGQLALQLPTRHAHIILHPVDAVVTTVDVPPLPRSRMEAAVFARVEPMILGDLEGLCLAHGPRKHDGQVQVAWASQRKLLQAWRLLSEAGLAPKSLLPSALAVPADDPHPGRPLSLPVDGRWQAPLPAWSLLKQEWRSLQPSSRWRKALGWAALAVVVWGLGLHWHAWQLRKQVETLQARMELHLRAAFPTLSVVLDPLRQAQAQVELLRAEQGLSGEDRFMSLALQTADVLQFAAGHVTALNYADEQLSLTLAEAYSPPPDEMSLQRSAERAGLMLAQDPDRAHVWKVRFATSQPERGRP